MHYFKLQKLELKQLVDDMAINGGFVKIQIQLKNTLSLSLSIAPFTMYIYSMLIFDTLF